LDNKKLDNIRMYGTTVKIEMESVYCTVRSESLYNTHTSLTLKVKPLFHCTCRYKVNRLLSLVMVNNCMSNMVSGTRDWTVWTQLKSWS